MATEKKRTRAQNYTHEETICLINLVKPMAHIVENKKTDSASSNEKSRTWENIALKYNARTTTRRTADQLRQKFDSLKKETRKYSTQLKQQRLKEGAEPCEESKPHPLYDKVMEIMKGSTEGKENHTDFEVTSEHEEHSRPIMDKNEELFSKIEYIEISEEMALPMEKDDIPILMCVPPASSSQETEPPVIIDKVTEEITSEPVSVYDKSLTPWITAKTELVQLQIKQQKKQFEEVQKREQELFLLKKRSLELDIAIKEQHLKKLKAQLISSFV